MKKLSILAIISSVVNLFFILYTFYIGFWDFSTLIIFGNGLFLIAFSFISFRFLNVNNLKSKIIIENDNVAINNTFNGNNTYTNDKIIDEDKILQLEKLGELKSKGLITDDEFQEQKKRIIG